MNILEIARAMSKDAKHKIIGIRPGEKLHEEMIGHADAQYTLEYEGHYKILPSINSWNLDPKRIGDGAKVDENFIYSSDTNLDWMDVKTLQEWTKKNLKKIGKI